ncbi:MULTISPECIES: bifunctional diaminohydroxyphosphoribosylaminopyrimidine deaminase/5-amino-6-(5-phosphoribosylamino)uracil reductase RibD [Thermoanaerobacter]|uniref:Riboflavin biosynthesis protein RibD n=1 Tax=Thermoanaerobacter pentosaceus TaxID=694059 RepID=A0ABT9M4P1_9THEO|nr:MULTISPECIES: bifunctional diaminohydroxyphosphoribosylaminopyrimidine deaminase/5-amino-6-(5-phosphoribosylamino)uracil reductase RibD [Thermoanaerobacter]MDP9751071.1 diaminohydroxyphosphoribosylaminopyrimidine deaminase/5-amino-6-(5-phosphoribosylamino)uracil reductase [Thermoanaerobacter pentosaceus]
MEEYMKRALTLAKKGWGYTNPNPLVGAVIVKNGKIIGEGYHEYFGGPHAEVNALKNAVENVEGSTMFVTLEPCSHYGKTPPCVEEIIKSGIKRVYIAMEDPNPKVSGNGIKRLKEAGIEVHVGMMEKEARKLNEIFVKYITTKFPFVILKSAMSIDGKIACYNGNSKWITNEKSRKFAHKIRGRVSAIMVGVNTVIKDNPMLTTRLEGYKNPVRIIVDSRGRIPLDSNVIRDKTAKTIIATTELMPNNVRKKLEDMDIEVITLKNDSGKVPLKELMIKLGERGIDSVLIEGGGTLNWSAFKEGIVDKVMFFISPRIIGGKNALTPVEGIGFSDIGNSIELKDVEIDRIDDDILITAYVRK